ncbi:MAG: PA2779 family protein [Terracidiphilus sp.]
MHSDLKQFARSITAAALVAVFAIPNNAVAQAASHVVSPSDLAKATVDASQQRQQNIDALNQFFSSSRAKQALESAHMNPQQVQKAVSGLSDEELAQLASRASKAQMDFAAGNMSDHDLLIILICIAALVLVIVAVH